MCNIINKITGHAKTPVDITAKVLPPPTGNVYQEKPTHIEATGIKYNAFNIDKISFDITSRDGFNNRTPDLIVWDQYKYNVQELTAHADENEITQFMRWSLKSEDLKDFNIDFSSGGNAVISGKYKGVLPFSVEMNIKKTDDNKLLFSFDNVKALFQMPNKIRDLIISSMLDLKDTPGLLAGISLKPAFTRFDDNKILFDPDKIKPGVNMPIKFFETSDKGFNFQAGNKVETKITSQDKNSKTPVNMSQVSSMMTNPQNPKVVNLLKLK